MAQIKEIKKRKPGAGRKAAIDPVVAVRFYIEGSAIEANEGMEAAKLACQKFLRANKKKNVPDNQ